LVSNLPFPSSPKKPLSEVTTSRILEDIQQQRNTTSPRHRIIDSNSQIDVNDLSISHSFSGELQTQPIGLVCHHSVTLEHYHTPAGALSLPVSKSEELNPTPIYPNITPTEIGTYNALVNNLPLYLVTVILYNFHNFSRGIPSPHTSFHFSYFTSENGKFTISSMRFISIISDLIQRDPTTMNPPLFIFKRCHLAAEHNAQVLEKHNYLLDKVIKRQHPSQISYGLEFRPSSILKDLLQDHPLWPKLQDILDKGIQCPLSLINDTQRKADLDFH
jgi:hypothetical protein